MVLMYGRFLLQSVESGNVVLDGGYIDLDPAKLAAVTTPTTSSVVSPA